MYVRVKAYKHRCVIERSEDTLQLFAKLTKFRGHSRNLTPYYLSNGVDAGAGGFRQLFPEIQVCWPFLIHWETGSEPIHRWVAHPQSLLETFLKGTTNGHDLEYT